MKINLQDITQKPSGFYQCHVSVLQSKFSRSTSFTDFIISTWYIFANQVFHGSCFLRHIRLRSFAVYVHLQLYFILTWVKKK